MNQNDPGLLYGANVFTTLRVYNHSLDSPLTNWQAHCDRLESSLQFFGWNLPDWDILRRGAKLLLKFYPVLRITVFPDGREWIKGRYLPENLADLQKFGAIATVSDPLYRRNLPLHKTGNYLAAWLARQEALKLGANETILIDNSANWLETATGNLWGFSKDCYFTPPLDGILPGIVRSQLLNFLAENSQLPVVQSVWDRDLVASLEAIAYSNSVVELIPVRLILTPGSALSRNPIHPLLTELRNFFK